MKTLNGFLFGHFDSRGGTAFVVAPNKREACLRYVKQWFGYDELDKETRHHMLRMAREDDFEGVCELHYPDDVVLETNQDLADSLGMVVHKGTRSLEEWTTADLRYLDDERAPEGHVEFVPQGRQPVKFADGWSAPRWDDDAYNFIILL